MVVSTSNNSDSAAVQCGAGRRALGGGGDTNEDGADLEESYPLESDGTSAENGDVPTGWRVEFNGLDADDDTTVWVVCAP